MVPRLQLAIFTAENKWEEEEEEEEEGGLHQ